MASRKRHMPRHGKYTRYAMGCGCQRCLGAMRRACRRAKKRKLAESTGWERRKKKLQIPDKISVTAMRKRAQVRDIDAEIKSTYASEVLRPMAYSVSQAGSYLGGWRMW